MGATARRRSRAPGWEATSRRRAPSASRSRRRRGRRRGAGRAAWRRSRRRSVAESTARSISAAVASAWNCRSSWPAIALNDAPSSSNSSRLLIETRLPKSRWAMRRVPSCSSRSGTRLRRMRSTLSTSTTAVDSQHQEEQGVGEPDHRSQDFRPAMAEDEVPGGRGEHLVQQDRPGGRDVRIAVEGRQRIGIGKGVEPQRLERGLNPGDRAHQDVAAVVLHREDGAGRDQALIERGPEIVRVDLAHEETLRPPRRDRCPGRYAAPGRSGWGAPRGAPPRGAEGLPPSRARLRSVRRGSSDSRPKIGTRTPSSRTNSRAVNRRAAVGSSPGAAASAGIPSSRRQLQGIRRDVFEGGVEQEEPLEDRGAEGLAGLVEAGFALGDEVLGHVPVGHGRHHGGGDHGAADEEEEQSAAEPASQGPRERDKFMSVGARSRRQPMVE